MFRLGLSIWYLLVAEAMPLASGLEISTACVGNCLYGRFIFMDESVRLVCFLAF